MSIWDVAAYGGWANYYGREQELAGQKQARYDRNREVRLQGEQAQAELEQRGQIAGAEMGQRAYENEAQRDFTRERDVFGAQQNFAEMERRAELEAEQMQARIEAETEKEVREYKDWRAKQDYLYTRHQDGIKRYQDGAKAIMADKTLSPETKNRALAELAQRETPWTPQQIEDEIEYHGVKEQSKPLASKMEEELIPVPETGQRMGRDKDGKWYAINPPMKTPETVAEENRIKAEKVEADKASEAAKIADDKRKERSKQRSEAAKATTYKTMDGMHYGTPEEMDAWLIKVYPDNWSTQTEKSLDVMSDEELDAELSKLNGGK